jgi:hypothetical protein
MDGERDSPPFLQNDGVHLLSDLRQATRGELCREDEKEIREKPGRAGRNKP